MGCTHTERWVRDMKDKNEKVKHINNSNFSRKKESQYLYGFKMSNI